MSWFAFCRWRILGVVLCILALSHYRTLPTEGTTLLVPEVGKNVVRHFALNGTDVGTFDVVGLEEPSGLALDAQGHLYVTNFAEGEPGTGTIRRFSPTGEDLGYFATGFHGPTGLAFDPVGTLYVAVGRSDNGAIRQFSPTGEDLGNFVTGLNYPIALAFDPAGNLYVTVAFDNTIRRFAPTGEDLRVFGTTVNLPIGLTFDQAGNLYVASGLDNTVRRFAPTGEDLGTFASSGLAGPSGLAFDPAGNLYVSNAFRPTIRRFAPTGEDLGDFATDLAFPYFMVFPSHAFPAPRPLLAQLRMDTEAAALPGAQEAQLLHLLDAAQVLINQAATQFQADHTARAIWLLRQALRQAEYYREVLQHAVNRERVAAEVAAPLLATAAQVTEQLLNGIDVLQEERLATEPDMGNAALEDAKTLRRVGFIHDGQRFHYFVMPDKQSTDPVSAPIAVTRGASFDLRYITGIAVDQDIFGFVWDRTAQTVQEIRRDTCQAGLGVSRANDRGDLLVYCFVAPDFHLDAYLMQGDTLTPLQPPGAGHVSPLGINNAGWVAGIWQTALDQPSHGFIGEPRGADYQFTSYDIPGAFATQLSGINDSGEVAGNFTDGDDNSRTLGPIFKLSGVGATPEVFDPGQGYVAVSWGIANNGWIHGYVELATVNEGG